MSTLDILNELLDLALRINQGLQPLDETASNKITANINSIKAETHILQMSIYKGIKTTSERENEIIAMVKGK